MVTRALGWDGLRFQAQDSWVTIITEVMRIEEFKYRDISTQTVHYIFSLLHARLQPPLPVTAYAPPPVPDAPQPSICPRSSEFSQGVLLEDDLEGCGSI